MQQLCGRRERETEKYRISGTVLQWCVGTQVYLNVGFWLVALNASLLTFATETGPVYFSGKIEQGSNMPLTNYLDLMVRGHGPGHC